MTNQPVIMVGFTPAALTTLATFQPERSVILVEHPDVVRRCDLKSTVAEFPVVREVIPWDYQPLWAADAFFHTYLELRPAAVAAVQEYPTPFAARLAERYGLPGASLGAALLLRDKSLLRKVTAAAGIANPESATVRDPAQVRRFMADHPGPIVLKPADRQGSVGTMIIDDPATIDEAWAECLREDEGPTVPDRRPGDAHMLAERFVRGSEYSVEMLVNKGRPVFANVTRKVLVEGPHPVEIGHVAPAGIPERLAGTLRAATEKVVEAVGFQTGIVHCEWILCDDTPYLVECAGRFAGGSIIELITRSYLVDLVRAFWTIMSGDPLPGPLPTFAVAQVTAVWFVRAEPGEVQAVDGIEQALAAPGVISCQVDVKPGDRVAELRNSWHRVGSAMAAASTATEALERARKAAELVQIKVS
jgi:biotin carboxylase